MAIIYKEESYKIIGACFEVYNEFGNGFDEPIYHESLMKEFELQSIPAVSEPQVNVFYKGIALTKYFMPDMVVYNKIIIELKAVKALNEIHRQQVLNYLKATGYKLGLLVNFGAELKLEYERIVL
ncbi:MAG: GxxExxY protein [Akkermansiaceae bacterium]